MLRVATLIQARGARAATVGQFLRVTKTTRAPGAYRAFSHTPIANKDEATDLSAVDNLTAIQHNVDAVAAHNAVDAFQTAVAPVTVDMGYSLAEMAIRTMDVVHAMSGLPWWATIIATTVIVRSAFFPISIMSMKNSARMGILQPKLEKLQNEIKNSPDAYDPAKMTEFRARAQALFKEHKVRPFMSFLMPISQLPIFLGFFWGLQDISKYIPGYATDGAFWFENLAAPDPTYALPVISSALMVASLEAGGEGMPPEYIDKAKMGMRAVALIMIPVAINFESGILLYWVTSNIFTLTQTLVLKIPGLKAALGIPSPVAPPPLMTASVSKFPSPFQAAVAQAQKNQPFIKTYANKPAGKGAASKKQTP
ncbi:hypothetical protein H310_05370 [Aphanomyces invadans]|uniref:Membrane insertase YidC/Oxa/ALB C-terminal domain-containing protein n=1 Tax=Aphanomyces invadans TaxID=157072 RepID=A0A024U946_9STRA|nr:hypothetical protein H310_05370 [Aphanomyces invadans]ETW02906.1 hypothetical protein H310_05370 [Aphanomyces invadans]|eukprot:XP_008868290.1 hypothetical protein H310_05370 [Aphanomyces invadans]